MLFMYVLHHWVLGQYRTGLDVYRHLINRRIYLVLLAALEVSIVPIVVPHALGQVYLFTLLTGIQHRRYEQLVAETKFLFALDVAIQMLFHHRHWPQDRKAVLGMFPKHRVDIWQQLIPQFDEFPIQRLAFRAKAPWFAFGRIARRVGAHKRREHPELYPSGEEFSVRLSAEPTDVGTTERQSRYGQSLQL